MTNITEKKKQMIDQEYENIDGEIFSICDGILMYSERVMMLGALKKEYSKTSIPVNPVK